MVKRIELTKRDRRILEHVRRYRMTTPEVLHQLFFAGRGKEAVRSTVRRLRHADYLQAGDLTATKRQYLRLGRLGVRVLGVPLSLCRPLGEQSLLGRYSVLLHCCQTEVDRYLLRPDEFEEEFQECKGTGIAKEPYVLEAVAGETRLCYAMVDYGADAGRVARKCQRAYGLRSQLPGFRDLLDADAFVVVVLTAEPTKKDAIVAAIRRLERLRHPVRVEALPGLKEVY